MNKAKELFDKILVDGQEIDLQALDANNGVYAAGEQKTLKVDFILKKKDEIPAKIFSGLSYLKSVIVPESVTTVGAHAFENTGAEITGLEQVETFGEGASVGAYMSYMSEEFISYIQEHNPEAFIERYTELEAIAYNSYLPGALKYGAIKTPAKEAVSEHWVLNGQTYNEDPTYEESDSYEYIYDETTWNESFQNGVLNKYYTKYPDEDLWNPTAHRAVNFNDKAYDVDIYEDSPAIYSFESFDSQEKTTKWGEGKVKVIEMRAGGATVEVIENESTDPNAANFVGNQYNVATGLATDEPIQLYTLNEEATGIWVTIELVSEATTANSETPARTGLSFKAGWVSDNVQSLTNLAENSSEVYYTDMFYSLDENKHELFTDTACTESANKFAIFNTFSFPGCTQCWEGAIKAPGSKYPWVAPYFDNQDINVKLIYRYDAEGYEDAKPWGDQVFGDGEGRKLWGIESVVVAFKDNSFLIPECAANAKEEYDGVAGEQSSFDINKFKLILEHQNVEHIEASEATEAVPYTNEEVDAHNAELEGAVKAGDIKVKQQEEQEPQENQGGENQGEQESQEPHENQTVNGEVTSEDGGDTQIYNG